MTKTRTALAAIGAAIGVALSAYMVLRLCEMFAALDGIGYGHREIQTWVSWAILAVVLLLVAVAAISAYKGGAVYAGILLVVWFGLFFPVMRTYGLHYDLVCDTVDAPWACYAGSGGANCTLDQDPECFRRLKRSCNLGLSQACERLVEQGAMTEPEICETLAKACDYTQQCAQDPVVCGRGDLPGIEEYFFTKLCDDYTGRCVGP